MRNIMSVKSPESILIVQSVGLSCFYITYNISPDHVQHNHISIWVGEIIAVVEALPLTCPARGACREAAGPAHPVR